MKFLKLDIKELERALGGRKIHTDQRQAQSASRLRRPVEDDTHRQLVPAYP